MHTYPFEIIKQNTIDTTYIIAKNNYYRADCAINKKGLCMTIEKNNITLPDIEITETDNPFKKKFTFFATPQELFIGDITKKPIYHTIQFISNLEDMLKKEIIERTKYL